MLSAVVKAEARIAADLATGACDKEYSGIEGCEFGRVAEAPGCSVVRNPRMTKTGQQRG